MKSTQHNGKHSLREKGFPNTKLWDYCLKLKLFFSWTVKQSYSWGDANKLLSFTRPRRNQVSTVWILLSIVSAYNWNHIEELANLSNRVTFATVSLQKKPLLVCKLKPSKQKMDNTEQKHSEQTLGKALFYRKSKTALLVWGGGHN